MDNLEFKIINLPEIIDQRGKLSFIENYNQVPFEIEKSNLYFDTFLIRSKRKLNEKSFLIALSGIIEITFSNNTNSVILNRPNVGVYLINGTDFNIIKKSKSVILLELIFK